VPSIAGLCSLFVSLYLRTMRKTEVRLGREAENKMWLPTEDPTPNYRMRWSNGVDERGGGAPSAAALTGVEEPEVSK
jgi:hypothetical protein